MELYLIRHAQSRNNLSMMYDPRDRVVDPALTDLGHQQAAAAGRYLAEAHNIDEWVQELPDTRSVVQGHRLTHLYCSPMLRTLQTCAPIARAVGLRAQVWPDTYEHGGMFLDDDHGNITVHTGLTRAAMLEQFPDYDLPPSITEQGWYDPALGREDTPTCMGRAIRVVDRLLTRAHTEDQIALVSHGMFISMMLKAVLKLLPSHDVFFNHYNSAITRIDFYHGEVAIRYLNRVDHLTPELMSH
jgi:2,3-bisphosphoglycerate-dependent phosphoglycerate mutase